jgi:hypothetical protein
MFPSEFRIPPPNWRPEVLDALRKLPYNPPAGDGSGPPPVDDAGERQRMTFLADLGTGLWRLGQKLIAPEGGPPPEGMRRVLRHLESVWDALAEHGVKVQDHTGAPVPDRGVYGLEALAYQETPGLTRDEVIETIKPSIFYRDRMIQMGQVIVGTPEQAQEKD